MSKIASRSLTEIERKMGTVEENSIRYQVLKSAKNFKTSWMDLGQALYTVWKDKSYKEWGYNTFDAFTSKEIGIRKPTAIKLLKSYYFLEKEEPMYLKKDYVQDAEPGKLPTCDSVNMLRLAKNKKAIDNSDYASIRRSVLDMGKDAVEVKKDLTMLMKQREELEPDEAREKKRTAVIKRLVTALKTLKTDIETSKLLPASFIKEISDLIKKVEAEII